VPRLAGDPAVAAGRVGGPRRPALILAGREDLRTPLEDQRRAALQLPRARVVAVPDVGHSVLGNDVTGCATKALAAFLTGGEVRGCTSACVRARRPAVRGAARRLGSAAAGGTVSPWSAARSPRST
jgi:hypothetical protein